MENLITSKKPVKDRFFIIKIKNKKSIISIKKIQYYTLNDIYYELLN
jgi:hypothetical protein